MRIRRAAYADRPAIARLHTDLYGTPVLNERILWSDLDVLIERASGR